MVDFITCQQVTSVCVYVDMGILEAQTCIHHMYSVCYYPVWRVVPIWNTKWEKMATKRVFVLRWCARLSHKSMTFQWVTRHDVSLRDYRRIMTKLFFNSGRAKNGFLRLVLFCLQAYLKRLRRLKEKQITRRTLDSVLYIW